MLKISDLDKLIDSLPQEELWLLRTDGADETPSLPITRENGKILWEGVPIVITPFLNFNLGHFCA